MPSLPTHHRFSTQGRHAQLNFAVSAELTALWTILFGPSGSGKSTILRALTGLAPHLTTNFERIDADQATHALSTRRSERRNLAYAPQGAPLFPNLSVRGNICFPETLQSLPSKASRLPEVADLLDLEPLLSKRPTQLSGGERQRVSLARALAVPNAGLLLLDEPFAGLDRALRDELLPRLQRYLAARALPVLSVTHDPDEALLLQAEILRLHEGHLVARGPARDVLADELARLRNIIGKNRDDGLTQSR